MQIKARGLWEIQRLRDADDNPQTEDKKKWAKKKTRNKTGIKLCAKGIIFLNDGNMEIRRRTTLRVNNLHMGRFG